MIFRLLLIPTVMAAAITLGASELFAAEQWPSMTLPKTGWRGPGFYLSLFKIFGCWFVFLMWVGSADWVSRDGQEVRMNYLRWNGIVFGTFLASFILVWVVPYFWVGFPLLVIAYLGPLITYVVIRNKQVMLHERVWTRDHIRYWLSVHLAPVGIKIQAEALDPHEKGPPVKLTGRGAETETEDNARLLAARQTEGLLPVREVLADGMQRRASALMLEFSQQNVSRRLMIDGVWHNGEPLERDYGDPLIESLKILSGLNPQDRQSRQKGTFGAEYENVNYNGSLSTQGTKAGERAMIELVDPKIRFEEVEELGMRAKIEEQMQELLNLEKGMLLFSTLPATGLRTTADVVIRHTDRLTREFVGIEEETTRYEDIENCPVYTYNAAKGETPVTILPKVIRMMPEVIVIRDLVDGETVDFLCDEIDEDRLILSTIRAKDSVEALLRVLALGADAKKFAPRVSGVFNQRLLRKLCDDCKEAYAPTPQVLQQLGIPQGRVEAFYRPPQEPEEVCETCGGIGYIGRTAVFELLVVGDTLRKVLAAGGKLDVARQAARKDGYRSLQEEGILMVAKGITSLPELMRVLK